MEEINISNDNYDKEENIENKNNVIYRLYRDALELYDKNCIEINKIKNEIAYIKFVSRMGDMDTIILYDDEKRQIYESRIQILGNYNDRNKIWSWGWSLYNEESIKTLLSRKIFDYAWNINDKNMKLFKKELIESNTIIKNPIQLDIKMALCSYITKKNFILTYPVIPIKLTDDNIINYKKLLESDDLNKGLVKFYYIVLID
jgi:hypothetical protein